MRKQFNMNEIKEVGSVELNNKLVSSLKGYLVGLSTYGGKFSQVESTVENLLAAISVESLSNSSIAVALKVSRKRVAVAREKSKAFDTLIDEQLINTNQQNTNDNNEIASSSDYSDVDHYDAFFNSSDDVDDSQSINSHQSINSQSVDSQSQLDSDETNSNNPDYVNKKKKSNAKNIFMSVLSPEQRKTRKDKLDLKIVRDFCHEMCRLDTFASAKILVHNCDGMA